MISGGTDLISLPCGVPICRMSLACEQDLHRSLWVIEEMLCASKVAEEKRGTLIGGEAASESNGQCVGIERDYAFSALSQPLQAGGLTDA